MNSNTPNYCPVCYTHMKKIVYPHLERNFFNPMALDFSGDGKADVVYKHGRDLNLFKTSGAAPHSLSLVGVHNGTIPAGPGGSAWTIRHSDQLYPGDFDNDGKVDYYVKNDLDVSPPIFGMLKSTGTGFQCIKKYSSTLAGVWTLASGTSYDKVQIGDFNGDKKADVFISNNSPNGNRVGIFISSGTGLTNTMNQSGSWTGWTMGAMDQYYLGDFNNDAKTDVYAHNVWDWGATRYLGMLKSTGKTLSVVKVFPDFLPNWSLGHNDVLYLGDFDGDKRTDLYIFNNGDDWSGVNYLGMIRSTGTDLGFVKLYSRDENIPGWYSGSGDEFYVADANKDGKEDLYVHNPGRNWGLNYLGTLISNGKSLSGTYSESMVGDWELTTSDGILPVRYEGTTGKSGIFITKQEWFGMIRFNGTGLISDRYYYRWIYTPLYDAYPWSDAFP
jgi:FG-GAP-like repeat